MPYRFASRAYPVVLRASAPQFPAPDGARCREKVIQRLTRSIPVTFSMTNARGSASRPVPTNSRYRAFRGFWIRRVWLRSWENAWHPSEPRRAPTRWITAASYSSVSLRAKASSYEPPRPPTEAAVPASAGRSL